MEKQLTFLAKSASFEKCTRDKKNARARKSPKLWNSRHSGRKFLEIKGGRQNFSRSQVLVLFDGKITWKIKGSSMVSEITFFYLLSYDMSCLRA